MRQYTKDNPLLMIPGPVESKPNVLEATAQRTYSHTESHFVESYQKALTQLRPVFGASDTHSPVAVAGGGTLAMEIALVNLIDRSKDQNLLVCEVGYFGDRYSTIAKNFQLASETIRSEIGEKISEEQLNSYLEQNEVDFAFIQHVDTSTGVANDIEMFGRICAEHDVISVVDGVCALGGQPLKQDDWGIDIYFTGAQKALAMPPGLAILMYSPQAREISENRTDPIPSYYANLDNWWSIMDAYLDGTVKYYSTPATNLILGLAQTTSNLLEEGMDKVYTRHEHLSTKFREEMSQMGFEYVTDDSSFANTMSTPKYLDANQGTQFRQQVLEEGVLIAGGIQKRLANTYFRVGHMGAISEQQVDFALSAIRKAI